MLVPHVEMTAVGGDLFAKLLQALLDDGGEDCCEADAGCDLECHLIAPVVCAACDRDSKKVFTGAQVFFYSVEPLTCMYPLFYFRRMNKTKIQTTAQNSVRAHIVGCGLGPVALAEQTGLTRQTILAISTHKGGPSIVTAWVLADLLDIPIDVLIGRTLPK